MIENTQPIKIGYQYTTPGYTRVYYLHSSYSDQDVVGKAIWVDGTLQPLDTNLSRLYFYTTGHTENTDYTTEAAYYDHMVDSALLAERVNVSISDPIDVTTRTRPTISSYDISSEEVDVGVNPPIVTLNLDGYADQLEIEWSVADADTWTPVYFGGFSTQVSVPNIPVGTVDIRVRGRILFPDGITIETSPWEIQEDVVVDWSYTPPNAPTNVRFTTAKLAEPSERYDVKVDWDWTRGSGSNVREFVLWSIPKSLYDNNPAENKWQGAELTNTGTGKSTVVINHPFNREMRYRVAAIAWGPDGDNTVFSNETPFTITDQTPIDNDFTQQTGIEVTYAHIKGLLNDGGTWKQTFLVNAADGAVAIGLLDEQGQAPITFDPANGTVNVKGQVISEEIIAASFVLSNLDGESNPKLYSSGKDSFADPTAGVFMGVDDVTQIYKFDIGDATKYIRWDGNKMLISGEVVIGTPTGEVPISDAGSGANFYSQAIPEFDGTFNETVADEFYPNTLGRAKKENDVLTQFNVDTPSISATRQWDGTAWIAPALAVHGSVFVSQSITADKLIANSAIINELGAEVIYDKPAYDGGNPEANYKMKIDLVNGSIHIR